MKTLSYLFSAVLVSASFLTGCDTIDNPIPTSPNRQLSDSLVLDSAEAAHGFKPAVQNVLLEDYTGHQCGNCPGAALSAKQLKGSYGDRLVVMAVHANYFAKSDKVPYTTDFTTPEGEEWYTAFGFSSNPNGMINRVPKTGSSSAVQPVANWSGVIATEMAKTPQINMTLTTLYDEKTRKVNIKVRANYLEALAGTYNLGVYLTEDSIVSYQKNYGASSGGDPNYPVGDVANYVHSHALRAAITGTWGLQNAVNPPKNAITNSYFGYSLNPGWRANHVSVVAFIYDVATKQIVQVQEQHLE